MFQTKEVANLLQVHASTVRRYSKDFAPHLSEYTQRNYRKYTDEDVAIMRRAMQLKAQGYTKAEINKLLATTSDTPESPLPAETLAIYPELTQAIEQARNERNKLKSQFDDYQSRSLQVQQEYQEYQQGRENTERKRFYTLVFLLAIIGIIIIVWLVILTLRVSP